MANPRNRAQSAAHWLILASGVGCGAWLLGSFAVFVFTDGYLPDWFEWAWPASALALIGWAPALIAIRIAVGAISDEFSASIGEVMLTIVVGTATLGLAYQPLCACGADIARWALAWAPVMFFPAAAGASWSWRVCRDLHVTNGARRIAVLLSGWLLMLGLGWSIVSIVLFFSHGVLALFGLTAALAALPAALIERRRKRLRDGHSEGRATLPASC